MEARLHAVPDLPDAEGEAARAAGAGVSGGGQAPGGAPAVGPSAGSTGRRTEWAAPPPDRPPPLPVPWILAKMGGTFSPLPAEAAACLIPGYLEGECGARRCEQQRAVSKNLGCMMQRESQPSA